MATINATTVGGYLEALPANRRETVRTVRQLVLDNLHSGFEECLAFGMIAYVVPLARYPTTYNGQPLMYAALASQKNYLTLHLSAVYGDGEQEFRAAYALTGKKLDMGESCVRIRSLDALATEPVAAAVSKLTVDEFIAQYERSRATPRARAT